MPARIRITVTGLPEVARTVAQLRTSFSEPKDGLIKAVHGVAAVFEKNYDSEGGLIPGGWPDLAERTQNIREWQGYQPDHPILIRYGALRGVAVEFFQQANGNATTSKGDNYSDNVVSGRLTIQNNVATMWVGGSYKVMNQFGYPNTNGSGDNPARPFWFVDRNSVVAARDGLKDWIESDVLKD